MLILAKADFHLKQIKLNLSMTANLDTNHQITKIKTKLNRLKIAEETISGSTRLFQRTPQTTLVNILLINCPKTTNMKKYSTRIM